MFGSLPWQDQELLRAKLAQVRAAAAQTRRSRLCRTGFESKRRGYWCLCIRKPGLLGGGENG